MLDRCCCYVVLRRICNRWLVVFLYCCLNGTSNTKNRIVCPRITDKNFNENSNYDRFSLYVESIRDDTQAGFERRKQIVCPMGN